MGIDRVDFDAVYAAARALCSGRVVLGEIGYSVGPWTPAVSDGFEWAVLNLQGSPLLLAHDAFEAARWFCQLEAGEVTPSGFDLPIRAWTDAKHEEHRVYEAWMYDYRFSAIGGYGKGREVR
jgi:hypothetical protein